jgi:hypothetical protein
MSLSKHCLVLYQKPVLLCMGSIKETQRISTFWSIYKLFVSIMLASQKNSSKRLGL